MNVPSTFAQMFICKLFEEILQVDAVGIDCDFIERGGHSLLVMQAVGKIREEFDIDSLTVREFLELRTARKIAQRIDGPVEVEDDNRRRKRFSMRSSITSIIKDDNPLRKMVVKAIAVLVLFISCGAAILPANMLLSASWGLRGRSIRSFQDSTEKFRLLMLAICAIVASMLVFIFCLSILARFYGYVLSYVIGKGPTTIKRSSATFGLWYVFDRLWFFSRMGAGLMFHGTKFHLWFYAAFGCSIGRDNFFEDADVRLPFMLTTGNNVVVEAGAKLETLVIKKNGDVAVDELFLGDNTVIGPSTHIGLGAKIGASCLIKSLSLVQRGRRIADSKMIMGHEVTELETATEGAKNDVEDQTVVSLGWHLMFLLISYIPAVMIILVSILILFLASFSVHAVAVAVMLYPIFMNLGVVIIAICMRPLRFSLIGERAKPGWERVYSKSFLRRNVATSLYHSCVKIFEGTVLYYFITRFIFGAEIDVRSSFTPQPEEPDLTKIGHCTFGANGIRVRNTSFSVEGLFDTER
mmetsp:Transcript_25950/g.39217  ORF Transcript_25950/g.39217 Transcript_25950/m.39217 type:complete len:524 (+) Transcript_25950:3-1574(+)